MCKNLVGLATVIMLSGCSSIPGISTLVSAPNVSGDWVVTRPNFSAFNWSIFEDGGTITGSAQNGGYNFPISGSRSGNKVSITIKLTSSSPTYSGELSMDGKKITGTIGGDSADTFVANKK